MRFLKSHFLKSCFAAFALTACTAQSPQAPSDVTLFVGGDILTMNDAKPMAQALAMKDGKILAVGTEDDVRAAAGKNAAVRDLDGLTLIPGLIDTHGHIAGGAFAGDLANLQPPPAGPVSNIKQLTSALQQWSADRPDAPWIMGFGYDDSLLEEGRHPTRRELDLISTEKPVMIMHVSGHLISCNTLCLAEGGITAETQNPPGGIIRREPGSNEPDGILEETARWLPLAKLPRPTAEQTRQAIINQQAFYASHGITTAQEGATDLNTIKMLQGMAANGQLSIDIVAFPAIKKPEDFTADIKSSLDYTNRFRVGGIKMTLDGSPQGKTAWLSMPYHIAPHGMEDGYAGYPIFKTEDVNSIVKEAFAREIPVIAHANGDAAADQILGSVKLANEALGNADRRTVIIHAQTAREDQIDMMKTENVMPSYFVAHTFFWGDWHRDSVLGETRAAKISPLKTTLSKGVPYTIHNDTPVVPPDMMRLAWTAVMRETRSGQTLGGAERVSSIEAFKALTINGAYQYFEEDTKGSLEAGKIADMVILSDNPASIPPSGIKDIRVVETIKYGQTIFTAKPE